MCIPNFIKKNIKSINKCLEVKIGDRFGMTGYVDFLQKEDFVNHNVIFGKDIVNRFFISVLYKDITNTGHPKTYHDDYKIMTIFQRYTNDNHFFVSCGDTFIYKGDTQTHNFLQNDIDKPIPVQFKHFFHLINDKEISITYNINKLYRLDDEYFNMEKTRHYALYNPEDIIDNNKIDSNRTEYNSIEYNSIENTRIEYNRI